MDYKLKVKNILDVIKGKLICGDENKIFGKFSKDTRTIKKGDTYIGIKGEKFDGSLFWKDALEKGADIAIIEETSFKNENIDDKEIEKYGNKTIILVEDTLQALYNIAKYKRSLYNIPVIAITGSVGKTSTKDIIYSVVSQKYKTLKTQGNNNNNIGMPLTILNLDDHEAIVLEMGMNHLGEISLLSRIAEPTISVIINVGTAHIGNLGSRENILKAKLEILDGMKEKCLVINNDNDLLNKWYEGNKEKKGIFTYGIENESNTKAMDILLKFNGSIFKCKYKDEEFDVEVPIGGSHFIYNALCAVTVGKILNIDNKRILKGLKEAELTKNRMDIQELKNGVKIINDSYNASYESMKVLLDYLGKLDCNRKIAVLGDMFELGEFSEELHRKVGEEVVKNNIDILICSGENSKYIVDEAIATGMSKDRIYYKETKKEIIDILNEMLQPGDNVLIKASNGMKYYEIINEIRKEI